MRVFVKICGLTTPRALDAAVTAGADAVGFVFAESPRRVTPRRAAELSAGLSPVVVRVAVMRHPTAAEWQAVAADFRPDWLQTEAADYERLAVAERFGRLAVYRDPTAPEDLPAGDDPILFEAGVSGQGQRANWGLAATLARRCKLVLAGGLTPDNVAEAIGTVRPWGVDVSSGVESRRGVKDPGRIAAFIQAVRAAELAHAV